MTKLKIFNPQSEAHPARTPDNEAPNYFRKAIYYAIGAVVLIPVVFNGISLLSAYRYWENSKKESGDMAKVLLILALQIPTIIALKLMYDMVSDLSSLLILPGE